MLDVEQEIYANLKARPETSRFRAGAEEFTVERRETVDVPAGRFEAFVILIERMSTNDLDNPDDPSRRNRERRAQRYWYAPALGWPVRLLEGVLRRDGSLDGVNWHLVEIKRP